MLHREDVALIQKAVQRTAVAVSIVQSNNSAASSINTFSLPYCEIEPFEVPDTVNDVAVVDVPFIAKDSAGNDALSIVMT